MQEKIESLKSHLADIINLGRAGSVLGWDQNTYMPPAGAANRGNQLAVISRIAHEWSTSAEMGALIADAEAVASQFDKDSDEARVVKVTRREFDLETRVPTDYVEERSRVTTMAFSAWVEARKNKDFSIFLPHLQKVVDLNRRLAGYFPEVDHPYDALLEQFEPGMKTSDVKAIFEALRPQQVELLKAIAAHPELDDSFLHQPFDEQKQWDFSKEIVTEMGYDWQRGRMDKAPHPFSTSFGLDDVRITVRTEADFFNPMLFGAMHEAGHALYEQGVSRSLLNTGLDHGASLAIHESQSRMWENLVGRSLPFWKHYYPRLQSYFPQLDSVTVEQFYRGINKVQPTMIRVEADEATYNMHIMLRLELEIAMIEGSIDLNDLPEIWNQKMQDYLGIVPANDAEGVLQDVHWSYGSLGYFSTYALGNLVSAQLWEKINQDLPGLEGEILQGKLTTLLAWLRENIHQHGRKFEPQEFVERITGERINSAAYVRYLKKKFGEMYSISF